MQAFKAVWSETRKNQKMCIVAKFVCKILWKALTFLIQLHR